MDEEKSQSHPRQTYSRSVDLFYSFVSHLNQFGFPGYTIIDSLILFNGTLYIVTDNQGRWPSLDRISAVTPSEEEQYKNDLRFISLEEAFELIPPLAGR